ncbi:MAG: AEC family transporter [Eubacteriales bacterium]
MTEVIINSVMLMGILIIIGYYLQKKGILSEKVEDSLTFILMYVSLPGLIIKAFQVEYTFNRLSLGLEVMLVAIIHSAILIAINFLLIFKIEDKEKKKILRMANVVTNSGFMGFPVVYQIFGQEGMFYASMFYIPIVVLTWTYGLMSFFNKLGKKEIKNMFGNPAIVALYIGFTVFIFQIEFPILIDKTLESLGSMTTPFAMFIIGGKLALVNRKEIFTDKLVYYGGSIKLILSPILMILVLYFFKLSPVARGVSIVYASLPPAAITAILAKQYKSDAYFASKVVVIEHLVSLITISIFLTIFL